MVVGSWPGTDPEKAAEKLWTQLGDLTRGLHSDANPTAKFIERSGDIYRVDPDNLISTSDTLVELARPCEHEGDLEEAAKTLTAQ